VLATLPRHFEVLIQAGNSARFHDDPTTAATYYGEAGRVRADSCIPPYNLACLRALGGDQRGALDLLDEATSRGFALPRLLDENADFDSLRTLGGWENIEMQVRMAAAARPRAVVNP
jgi:hypothetical protein